jgi:cleavage and polyadenylation specificity factor subunit 3
MATVLPSPGAAGGADEELRIEMLGAGQEVGRSCCVLTYKGEQREEQSAAAVGHSGASDAVRVKLG